MGQKQTLPSNSSPELERAKVQKQLDRIAEQGDLETVDQYAQQGLYPTEEGAFSAIIFAAGRDDLETIQWFSDNGYTIPEQTIDMAIHNGSIRTLDWLEENGVKFTQKEANLASMFGSLNSLRWLAKRRIYPDQENSLYIGRKLESHLDRNAPTAQDLVLADRYGFNDLLRESVQKQSRRPIRIEGYDSLFRSRYY